LTRQLAHGQEDKARATITSVTSKARADLLVERLAVVVSHVTGPPAHDAAATACVTLAA